MVLIVSIVCDFMAFFYPQEDDNKILYSLGNLAMQSTTIKLGTH